MPAFLRRRGGLACETDRNLSEQDRRWAGTDLQVLDEASQESREVLCSPDVSRYRFFEDVVW
jgi:hypothetical protein